MAAHIGVATPMQIQWPIRNVAALFANVETHKGLGLYFLQMLRLTWEYVCTFGRRWPSYGIMAMAAHLEEVEGWLTCQDVSEHDVTPEAGVKYPEYLLYHNVRLTPKVKKVITVLFPGSV